MKRKKEVDKQVIEAVKSVVYTNEFRQQCPDCRFYFKPDSGDTRRRKTCLCCLKDQAFDELREKYHSSNNTDNNLAPRQAVKLNPLIEDLNRED